MRSALFLFPALALGPTGGCDFSAATTILDDSASPADADADADSDADSDAESDADSDSGALPADIDDDADGYTENEGDCLDSDRAVHPGADDGCDGVDSDCDGAIDDDAPPDAWEPNDDAPYNLGSLEVDPEIAVAAWLTNDDDVDRYQFTLVDDTLDFFTLAIHISDIPANATYLVTFNRLRSDGDAPVGPIDQVWATGSAAFEYGDTTGYEDGGDYEIVVESIAGASCAHGYLLAIAQ